MDKKPSITEDFADRLESNLFYGPEEFAKHLLEEFFSEYNLTKIETAKLLDALTQFAQDIEDDAISLARKWDEEAQDDYEAREEGRKGNY